MTISSSIAARFAAVGAIVLLVVSFASFGAVKAFADLDTTRPDVTFKSVTVSGVYTVEISGTDASEIDSMAINLHGTDYRTNPGHVVKTCSSRNLSGITNTLSCTIDTTQYPDGEYLLKVGAFDGVHNNKTLSETFIIANHSTVTTL